MATTLIADDPQPEPTYEELAAAYKADYEQQVRDITAASRCLPASFVGALVDLAKQK